MELVQLHLVLELLQQVVAVHDKETQVDQVALEDQVVAEPGTAVEAEQETLLQLLHHKEIMEAQVNLADHIDQVVAEELKLLEAQQTVPMETVDQEELHQ
jgi:hypothetical protein